MKNIGPYTFESWIPFLAHGPEVSACSASMRYYMTRAMEYVHGLWKVPAVPQGLMPMEKYIASCGDGILGHLTLADGPIEWHPTVRICDTPAWFQPILEVKPGEIFTYTVLRRSKFDVGDKWKRTLMSDSVPISTYGWVGIVPADFFMKHQDPKSMMFRIGFMSHELES